MLCISCDQELPEEARFCPRCGRPTGWGGAAGDADPQAENRSLTVVFCDLVGSTALSGRIDPEALLDIVRAYQERASAVVARFEGHVAQYLGDGILVYFGYPRAHEDDAERAVRAGLEIPRALHELDEDLESRHGFRLAVRIGIHSGPVVMGEMGGGSRRETLAMGATTNIAARLQSLADPGSVVVSDATLRLVDGLFEVEDLGTPSLHGVQGAVGAYRVVRPSGLRSRLRTTARLTPFVARVDELRTLTRAWRRARAGENRTLLLTGEAGIGKSRLLSAFQARLADEPHSWLECSGSVYTQNSAFHPIRELMEAELGLADAPASDEAILRLEAQMEAIGMPVAETVPLLASLLSIPSDLFQPPGLSPVLERHKILQACVDWLRALGRRQTLVLVVEDLQWCDPSTLELLQRLREVEDGLLALYTHRSDFEPPWDDRGALETVQLTPLGPEDMGELVQHLSRERGLTAATRRRIVELADGIPLFAEELTRMLLESPITEDPTGETTIPATLQGLLTARLDRLGGARSVAQHGAVLGREFSYELLAAASDLDGARLDGGLCRLVEAGLLHRRESRSTTLYTFHHALIQDMAYRSLVRRDRRRLHARVAEALEARFPEVAAAEPELLARHFDGAGLDHRAARAYLEAAEGAARRAANTEALRLIDRGLDLVKGSDDGPEAANLELLLQILRAGAAGSTKGYSHPEVRRAADRVQVLARRIGEGPELEKALIGLWVHHMIRADLDLAAEQATELLTLADTLEGHYVEALAHGYLAGTEYFRGRFPLASQHLRRALDVYRAHSDEMTAPTNQVPPNVFALAYAPYVAAALGEESSAYGESALVLAERDGSPISLCHALSLHARFQFVRGDRKAALRESLRAVEVTRSRGFLYHLALSTATLGWAMAKGVKDASERERGLRMIEEAVAGLERQEARLALPTYALMRADLLRDGGDFDAALRVLDDTRRLTRETGQRYCEVDLDCLEAEILAATGSPDDARASWRRAERTAECQEAPGLAGRVDASRRQASEKTGEVTIRTPRVATRRAPS